MKRIIRLTESDLTRIVRRVIKEQTTDKPTPGKKYTFEGKSCTIEKVLMDDSGYYLILHEAGCRKSGIVDGVKGYMLMNPDNGSLQTRFEYDSKTKKYIQEPSFSLGYLRFD
jgi:hypothetical protein